METLGQISVRGAQAEGLAAAIVAAAAGGRGVLLTAQAGGWLYVAGEDQSINVSPIGEQMAEVFE